MEKEYPTTNCLSNILFLALAACRCFGVTRGNGSTLVKYGRSMTRLRRKPAGFLRNRVILRPYLTNVDPFPLVTPKQRQAARAKNSILDKQFVVGYSFSMASNYERKN